MPDLPCRGGGVNPTSMAQNDTHVALIILTTQMWGGELLVEKTFSGQNSCSCAFGANIRSYTKQRARHRTPFLQPPPPSVGGRPCHPPPLQSNFQVALSSAPYQPQFRPSTPHQLHATDGDWGSTDAGQRSEAHRRRPDSTLATRRPSPAHHRRPWRGTAVASSQR